MIVVFSNNSITNLGNQKNLAIEWPKIWQSNFQTYFEKNLVAIWKFSIIQWMIVQFPSLIWWLNCFIYYPKKNWLFPKNICHHLKKKKLITKKLWGLKNVLIPTWFTIWPNDIIFNCPRLSHGLMLTLSWLKLIVFWHDTGQCQRPNGRVTSTWMPKHCDNSKCNSIVSIIVGLFKWNRFTPSYSFRFG